MSKEMRMHSAENQRTCSWLGKALCRRYALVHFAEFNVLGMENGMASHQRWSWAFALFAADEFDILGAWPVGIARVQPIIEDLWSRGILSIRVVSIAKALDYAAPRSVESWASALRGAEPRVLEVIGPQTVLGAAVEGVPSAAIRSTLGKAGKIHDSLVRGVRSRAPFASPVAASEFIAGWLQRADRRLYEVRRPARPALVVAA
ncbi:hypothetical protein SNE35_02715 [Paucibacter sp. R3-3]|uniref:Uncharacterized protein n=1 Tax=Roseateles agri TaxID=3098619 RepID=A0ABU5DAW6_9BURK|nr:hypothetical protein [Paucibacter sp. R3-3]MDY0743395.1 hypothetical protein [Paucibacter sp. R3-3]